LEKRDFLTSGLFSWRPDCEGRPLRVGRRLDPLRDERRAPLGEYSDDMISVIALRGLQTVQEYLSCENGADGSWAPDAAHLFMKTCTMHAAKNVSDAMNADQ
jgi:hypothetical protein